MAARFEASCGECALIAHEERHRVHYQGGMPRHARRGCGDAREWARSLLLRGNSRVRLGFGRKVKTFFWLNPNPNPTSISISLVFFSCISLSSFHPRIRQLLSRRIVTEERGTRYEWTNEFGDVTHERARSEAVRRSETLKHVRGSRGVRPGACCTAWLSTCICST